jgi:hypothetical protein
MLGEAATPNWCFEMQLGGHETQDALLCVSSNLMDPYVGTPDKTLAGGFKVRALHS